MPRKAMEVKQMICLSSGGERNLPRYGKNIEEDIPMGTLELYSTSIKMLFLFMTPRTAKVDHEIVGTIGL